MPLDAQTRDTLIEQDMAEAVRATALLADVSISVWGAERTDPKIMTKAKADAGATGNVGRAIKNMLAGADENLKATRAAFAAVRATHYALTLPWVSNPHADRMTGPRLLPNALFEKYLTAMSTQKRAALQALDKFIDGYDDDVQRARANLAALADADYPTADQVRGMFRVAFDFEPIPAGAGFKGLPPAFAGKLAASLRAKQEAMIASSQAAIWEEVRERVTHLHTRLADPDAKFKASTIENVRELITLLSGWNVTGDARVDEIVEDIDRMLFPVPNAETVRDEPVLRAQVASMAGDINNKLNAWGL
jgi:hypothetical protein